MGHVYQSVALQQIADRPGYTEHILQFFMASIFHFSLMEMRAIRFKEGLLSYLCLDLKC